MKNIKLTVPESWNDITVRQYQKFTKILKLQQEERQRTIDIVSVFCNVDKKLLKKFKMKDLDKISNIIVSMTKEDPSNIKMEKNIEFNSDKYGVIPNMSEMTTGEFVDLESYCEESTENLHKILSVLYRKQKDSVDYWGRYQVEDYNPSPEKHKLMLDLPMNYALGVLNFFFHLGDKLLADSDSYLMKLK
tara:strand:+ start:119 stop:688 length:570 start_codon:yes stop_codon:yes gene_type:complete